MDPNNTTTNPLGSSVPSGTTLPVDDPVSSVGAVQAPVEPVAGTPVGGPTVSEPTQTDNPFVSGESPTLEVPDSGEPTAPEPTVTTELPAVEETVEAGIADPTVETADTTGLGGVAKPTV